MNTPHEFDIKLLQHNNQLTQKNEWLLDVIVESGYSIDTSILEKNMELWKFISMNDGSLDSLENLLEVHLYHTFGHISLSDYQEKMKDTLSDFFQSVLTWRLLISVDPLDCHKIMLVWKYNIPSEEVEKLLSETC